MQKPTEKSLKCKESLGPASKQFMSPIDQDLMHTCT